MKAPYEGKSIKQGGMTSVLSNDMVGDNIKYTVGGNINNVVGEDIKYIVGGNILLRACHVMGLFAGLLASA
jgi:hypothetical protein